MRTNTLHVIGERRRAEHQDDVVTRKAGDDLGAIGREKAREETVIFRKAVARRHGTHPHLRLVALRESDRFVPCVIARGSRPDDERRPLRRGELARDCLEQRRIASQYLTDLTRLHRLAHAVPVVDRN